MTLDGADRLALRALVDAYAVAVDRRDIPGFLAVFTPDATLTTYEPGGRSVTTKAPRASETVSLWMPVADWETCTRAAATGAA